MSQERANAPAVSPGGERRDGGAPSAVGPKKFPVQLHKEALVEGCERQPVPAAGSGRVLSPPGMEVAQETCYSIRRRSGAPD